ncbi:KGG domain-containing protein [Oligoflexus tunisiensis]|uniref:KGG domain-containing protein n=1 Tax=Oligoflexus tunisiensis TaxID=708132 RepID=UPI003F775B3E
MDPEQQREIASKGGHASHKKAEAADSKGTSGQDHGLEADMSASDVQQQKNLSRGESDEVRTSGDEDEVDEDHLKTSGGGSNRQSGREDLHA